MYHSNHLNSMQQTQGIETLPHITDHQMILDTLSHPLQSPIRALQTFFGIALLAGSCILSTPSLSSAAELFPFSPPTSQQRSVDQAPQVRPQLSREDINRITRLVDQAKKLSPDEQRQLRVNIQRKQKEAVRQGNLNQAQYYTELLTQIGQENP
jgi:ribosomal protein S13